MEKTLAASVIAVTNVPALMKTFLKSGWGRGINPKRAFPDLAVVCRQAEPLRQRDLLKLPCSMWEGIASVNQNVISA